MCRDYRPAFLLCAERPVLQAAVKAIENAEAADSSTIRSQGPLALSRVGRLPVYYRPRRVGHMLDRRIQHINYGRVLSRVCRLVPHNE